MKTPVWTYRIDWRALWRDFNGWYAKEADRHPFGEVAWSAQKKKITALVKRHLKFG